MNPTIGIRNIDNPADVATINDNFGLIIEAIERLERFAGRLAHEVRELRAAMPIGDDEAGAEGVGKGDEGH